MRLILLFLGLIFTASITAQRPDEAYVYKYVPAHETYEMSKRYRYTYQPSSNMYLASYEQDGWNAEAADWTPQRRYYRSFDDAGYLIKSGTDGYSEGEWKLTYASTYTYDVDDNGQPTNVMLTRTSASRTMVMEPKLVEDIANSEFTTAEPLMMIYSIEYALIYGHDHVYDEAGRLQQATVSNCRNVRYLFIYDMVGELSAVEIHRVDEAGNYKKWRKVVFSQETQLQTTNVLVAASFSIHPNPATNWVTVNFNNVTDIPERLYVMDILGQEVKIVNSEPGQSDVRLNVDDLQPGTYFIRSDEMEQGLPLIVL